MTVDSHDLPPHAHSRVDPFVQRWVAGTNGRLYVSLIDKLERYPLGKWPGQSSRTPGSLLLDIGCGWGRWMVGAARQGFTPLGIDVKIEPLLAAQRVMKHHGVRGFVVAADLRTALPFRSGVFGQVYSYSVLQHVHRDFARECINECARVLCSCGTALLEFPVSHGLTNFRHGTSALEKDPESWCVRYYSFRELKELFRPLFTEFALETDCYFGIGVRPEDWDLLPWPQRLVIAASEVLRSVSRVVPPLRLVSDSVFVNVAKPTNPAASCHPPDLPSDDNLGVIPLLQCPLTGSPLEYDRENSRLISRKARKAYPIIGNIPVMLPGKAVSC